jgi:hypothetical protein
MGRVARATELGGSAHEINTPIQYAAAARTLSSRPSRSSRSPSSTAANSTAALPSRSPRRR